MAKDKNLAESNRLERELRMLGKKVDAVAARAREAQRRARAEHAKSVRALAARQAEARKSLARMKQESANASEQVKAALARARGGLEVAIREVGRKLREPL